MSSRPPAAVLGVEGVGQADGDVLTRHPAAKYGGVYYSPASGAGSKDSDRYKVAKCIQAEPVFCGFGRSAHSKVISVSVLSHALDGQQALAGRRWSVPGTSRTSSTATSPWVTDRAVWRRNDGTVRTARRVESRRLWGTRDARAAGEPSGTGVEARQLHPRRGERCDGRREPRRPSGGTNHPGNGLRRAEACCTESQRGYSTGAAAGRRARRPSVRLRDGGSARNGRRATGAIPRCRRPLDVPVTGNRYPVALDRRQPCPKLPRLLRPCPPSTGALSHRGPRRVEDRPRRADAAALERVVLAHRLMDKRSRLYGYRIGY